jgi:hypothetical protein
MRDRGSRNPFSEGTTAGQFAPLAFRVCPKVRSPLRTQHHRRHPAGRTAPPSPQPAPVAGPTAVRSRPADRAQVALARARLACRSGGRPPDSATDRRRRPTRPGARPTSAPTSATPRPCRSQPAPVRPTPNCSRSAPRRRTWRHRRRCSGALARPVLAVSRAPRNGPVYQPFEPIRDGFGTGKRVPVFVLRGQSGKP